MSEDDRVVAIGVVAHHAFCPRRAWLEVHGEKTDTAQVATGVRDHAAVDDASTSRGFRLRGVEVWSDALGIRGRCDSIEVDDDGAMTIVEHKAAPVRRRSVVTDPQRVQLALQAICLRERGNRVAGAAVWFSTTRSRVTVDLDEATLARARDEVVACRSVLSQPTPPPPLPDDDRCRRCSHVSVCLPDEHRGRVPARRIGVADPVGRPLHLTTPGSRASLGRGRIRISTRDEEVTVPVEQAAGLVVHGNADVSSALVREMLLRGHPIVWCTWSGRVTGWASPADAPNGNARRLQHRLSDEVALACARTIVAAKIRNQRRLMRRHGLEGRDELRTLADLAGECGTVEQLFGVEGRAAARYFGELGGALRPEWATIDRRVARPAPDPVNAALNVAYGLLLADVIRAVVACGLDPAGGVLHSSGRNKPALALDLMEELRSPVADAAVIWAINNGELKASSFRKDVDAVRLTESGRKALIAAYERRVTETFRHPHFGYEVTWRRAMEVQARMFLAVVTREADLYRPIEVR
jgi:CRISPR-associated protein Cas1